MKVLRVWITQKVLRESKKTPWWWLPFFSPTISIAELTPIRDFIDYDDTHEPRKYTDTPGVLGINKIGEFAPVAQYAPGGWIRWEWEYVDVVEE